MGRPSATEGPKQKTSTDRWNQFQKSNVNPWFTCFSALYVRLTLLKKKKWKKLKQTHRQIEAVCIQYAKHCSCCIQNAFSMHSFSKSFPRNQREIRRDKAAAAGRSRDLKGRPGKLNQLISTCEFSTCHTLPYHPFCKARRTNIVRCR